MKVIGAFLVIAGIGLVVYAIVGSGADPAPVILIGCTAFCLGMFSFLLERRRNESRNVSADGTDRQPVQLNFRQMRDLADEILPLLREGKKIEAVQKVRERTGQGLRESKEIVDKVERMMLKLGDTVFDPVPEQPAMDGTEQRILDILATRFNAEQGIDLREDPVAMQRLRAAAKKAMLELAEAPQTQVLLPYIAATSDGPKHLETMLTKEETGV